MPENEQTEPKIITLDNKKYNLDDLSDDVKNQLRGIQICDTQLRFQQDTLKLLSISRQTMVTRLQESIKDIDPIE